MIPYSAGGHYDMTKTDKLLAKLKSSKTLTWNELAGALKVLGYQQVEGDGSRVKFDNGIPKEL
ncbi:hypothetical protein ACMYQ1_10440 [Shewanella oncorhynchi]|uniref:hypothetical protein n=1 Tax=Shewanella oncorhynchi TaxID=2726434 RepID=UPI0039F0C486